MPTTNTPPLNNGRAILADADKVLDLWGQDSLQQTSNPVLPQDDRVDMAATRDITGLYRQMELKLESVVERLLVSKVAEDDNLLASMQALMDRVFVSSAMRMAQGNISRAAKLLGINRNTLSKKLKTIEAGARTEAPF